MDSYKINWDIIKTIYSKSNKTISVVKHITDDYKMILKYGKDVEDELHHILTYGHIFVNSPYLGLNPTNKRLYWDDNWFIMNRYHCSLLMDLDYGLKHIDVLITDLIDSIKKLHCNNTPLVHLDIKLDNILIDKENCRFILSDYELVQNEGESTMRLSSDEPDSMLYYLSRGVRTTDRLISFRTDLICFGMVLWRVLRKIYTLELEQECEIVRREIKNGSEFYIEDLSDILDLQYEMYSNIPEELKEYYQIVFGLKDVEEPHTEKYYDDLKESLMKALNKC
jgi:serine/threonine protein kinase